MHLALSLLETHTYLLGPSMYGFFLLLVKDQMTWGAGLQKHTASAHEKQRTLGHGTAGKAACRLHMRQDLSD